MMFTAKVLIIASLAMPAALNTHAITPKGDERAAPSMVQRMRLFQRALGSSLDCFVNTILADPALARSLSHKEIGDLIVKAAKPCAGAMRSMIDEHNRFFGPGTGGPFFEGPFMDMLAPTIVPRLQLRPAD